MATPKSTFKQEGNNLDYTPSAAKTAGDMVQVAGLGAQVVTDLDAAQLGSVAVRGVITVRKDATAVAEGGAMGWDNDGTAVGGATGGAATSGTDLDFAIGKAVAAAGTADAELDVILNAYSA